MSLKKTVAIAAAVGAMAAISVPAMAFENEFHGMYKFKTVLSNFDAGGTATNSTFSPTLLNEDNKTNNYLEQRARIVYIAKASDDLKLVTQFELDARFGGTNGAKYGPAGTSTDAGSLDSDGISLETKHVYLDFNLKPVNVKVGIQPYKDALKGVFLDGDIAAVNTTTKIGALTVGAAFARLYDGSGLGVSTLNGGSTKTGDRNDDVFLLDSKFAITKDASVGFSYYFLADYLNNTLNASNTLAGFPAAATTPYTFDKMYVHTFALNGDAKVGPVTLSGFAAYQAGFLKAHLTAPPASNETVNLHGYALNAAAKMAAGPGTLKGAALFTSGDEGSDKQYNAWMPVKTIAGTGGSGSAVTSYNEGGTMLLVRNTAQNNTNTDKYVVGTPDNGGKGLGLVTLGYDANITPKFYVNTNLALGWAAKNAGAPIDRATGRGNATNFLGTEINVETGYKVSDNLTASVQAAYLMLGGYYAGAAANSTLLSTKDPENPYTGRVVLSYAF